MDVKAHEQYRTDAGEDIVIVPIKEYAMLVSIRKAYFDALEQGIQPCEHPEDMLSGVEILPDFCVCAKCGALLKLEEGQPGFPVWARANIHDLEARLYDTFQQALGHIDYALSELRNRSVVDMISWATELHHYNPVLREREEKHRRELSQAILEKATNI
jgi:hypothetical protein